MSNLLIVESPGKIKKIESILGSSYKVVASYGHIIDLPSKSMNIDIENKFKPNYDKNADKVDKIKEIIKSMKKADTVFLASDEDREGEMIAWSLKYIAEVEDKSLYKNKIKDCKRIVFNSITKSGLLQAIKNPKDIDMDMVHAQQARRLLDRIVGYELSPLLWGIAKGTLSAGRVQSVVARLIVDREKEIQDFLKSGIFDFYKFNGKFKCNKTELKAIMYDKEADDESEDDDLINSEKEKKSKKSDKKDKKAKIAIAKIKDQDNAMKIIEKIKKSKFEIDDIIEKERKQNPGAPFTTSTLQQEAGRKLGFDVKRTMMAAQKLYEAGYITYMRTDSTNLSDDAIENIKKYINQKYSAKDYERREYKSKAKNTQEAHEACRATDVFKEEATGGSDEQKLYSLIWKRTVASQMQAAIYDVLELIISISKLDRYFFKSIQEVLKYPGFLQVYNIKDIDPDQEKQDDTVKIKKPDIGDKIKAQEIKAMHEFKRPPPRYNEISLVNKLDPKNLGIGRPATYASIISKIQERKYVEIKDLKGSTKDITNLIWDGGDDIVEEKTKITIGNDKKKLVPTDLGIKINGILMENFPSIMDYKFTAHMENELDSIASGDKVWYKVLQTFYDEFHPLVVKMKGLRKTYKADTQVIGTYKDLEIHLLTTGTKPLLRYGGNGKTGATFCEIDCEIDDLTEKYAIKLLKEKMSYPKSLGDYKDKEIVLNTGKFGFYIKYGTTNISADKNIDLDAAIELIKQKLSSNLASFESGDMSYTVLNGQYGPYIRATNNKTKKNTNVKIPKDKDPKNLSEDEIKELVSNYDPSKRFNKAKRKTDKDDTDDTDDKQDKKKSKAKAKPKTRYVKKNTNSDK